MGCRREVPDQVVYHSRRATALALDREVVVERLFPVAPRKGEVDRSSHAGQAERRTKLAC